MPLSSVLTTAAAHATLAPHTNWQGTNAMNHLILRAHHSKPGWVTLCGEYYPLGAMPADAEGRPDWPQIDYRVGERVGGEWAACTCPDCLEPLVADATERAMRLEDDLREARDVQRQMIARMLYLRAPKEAK